MDPTDMDLTDLETAVTAVQEADTSAADLVTIAARHPSLRSLVAQHPNTDPDLLNWLASQGDPIVCQVVEYRRRAGTEGPVYMTFTTVAHGAHEPDSGDAAPNPSLVPAPNKQSPLWLLFVVAALVVGFVIGLGTWWITRLESTPQQSHTSSPDRTAESPAPDPQSTDTPPQSTLTPMLTPIQFATLSGSPVFSTVFDPPMYVGVFTTEGRGLEGVGSACETYQEWYFANSRRMSIAYDTKESSARLEIDLYDVPLSDAQSNAAQCFAGMGLHQEPTTKGEAWAGISYMDDNWTQEYVLYGNVRVSIVGEGHSKWIDPAAIIAAIDAAAKT